MCKIAILFVGFSEKRNGNRNTLQYNAFEISAHAMSAPDHEPVQGHVFLVDEFYKLQQNQPSQDADGHTFEAIRRPSKEWNCGHFHFNSHAPRGARPYIL